MSAQNTHGEESTYPTKSGTHPEMLCMTKGKIGTEMKISFLYRCSQILATRLYPSKRKQKPESYTAKE